MSYQSAIVTCLLVGITQTVAAQQSAAPLQAQQAAPPPSSQQTTPERAREKPVMSLEGRIFIPGMEIPRYAEAVTDIRGQPVRLLGPGKQLIAFTSPRCRPCLDMINAVESTLDQYQLDQSLHRVYVVTGDAAAAQSHLAPLLLRQLAPGRPQTASQIQVVADPGERIAAHLKIAFKPYGLLLEDGALKYPLIWEKDANKTGSLVRFFILGLEGMKAAEEKARARRAAEGVVDAAPQAGAGPNAAASAPRSPPAQNVRP